MSKEAIKHDCVSAMNHCADLYIGKGNFTGAISLHEKAIKHKDFNAAYNLGCMYRDGISVDSNLEEARYYYEKAKEFAEEDSENERNAIEQLNNIGGKNEKKTEKQEKIAEFVHADIKRKEEKKEREKKERELRIQNLNNQKNRQKGSNKHLPVDQPKDSELPPILPVNPLEVKREIIKSHKEKEIKEIEKRTKKIERQRKKKENRKTPNKKDKKGKK